MVKALTAILLPFLFLTACHISDSADAPPAQKAVALPETQYAGETAEAGQNEFPDPFIVHITKAEKRQTATTYSPEPYIRYPGSGGAPAVTPEDVVCQFVGELPPHKRLLFSLYDFETGRHYHHNGDIRVFPASLIKTLYLTVYLDEVQALRQDLYAAYTLQRNDKFIGETPVLGMGYLQSAKAGSAFTYNEILNMMTALSDNIAANIITDRLGFSLINRKAREYGLKNTSATIRMFDHTSSGAVLTTMNDLTTLLVLLEKQKILSDPYYQIAVSALRASDKDRIGKYAPPQVFVANKIGTVAYAVSDMALIYFPDRAPLAMSVMIRRTDGQRLDPEKGEEMLARFARDVITAHIK